MSDLEALLLFLLVALVLFVCSTVSRVVEEAPFVSPEVLHHVKQRHFIQFSLKKLIDGLEEDVWVQQITRGEGLRPLTKQLEMIFVARFAFLKKVVQEDFELFDPDCETGTCLPISKIEQLQNRFISNLAHVLEKANFERLSKESSEAASAQSFFGTNPVEPEWLKLEPVFRPYLERHPFLSITDPPFSSRMWIFHRGCGISKQTGFFLGRKLEILFASLTRRLFLKKRGSDSSIKRITKLKSAGNRSLMLNGYLRARTLNISIDTIVASTGWKSLWQVSSVQDLMFTDVVMVYRNKDKEKTGSSAHSFSLQVFRNFPKSDLNMLYPCNKALLSTVDKVVLSVTGIVCILCFFYTAVFGIGLFCVILGVLFVMNHIRLRTCKLQITSLLYDKLQDTGNGALIYLVEQVVEQEVKEAFLGYVFLLMIEPESRTKMGLHDAVQSYMDKLSRKQDTCQSVLFETDDALKKLLELGIVCQDSDTGLLEPQSFYDCLEKLDCQWRGMLKKAK
jgi:hypothetical protein